MELGGNYLATREGLILLHICGVLLLKTRVILQLGYIFYYKNEGLPLKQAGAPSSSVWTGGTFRAAKQCTCTTGYRLSSLQRLGII